MLLNGLLLLFSCLRGPETTSVSGLPVSDMCFGRQARIEDKGHDRYGRTIGRVWCAGVDANAQQVQRGMARVKTLENQTCCIYNPMVLFNHTGNHINGKAGVSDSMNLGGEMLINKRESFVKIATLLLVISSISTVMAQGLEEIIVTAQRRSQNLQDVPISVNVFNSEQLGRAQISLMRDLANIAPSLNFQGSSLGMNNNLSMRGIGAFAPQAGIQPAVALVVDDFPISRQGELDMDMSDVESVQILSGPQGTLFGSNTVGGVVNITTKQPTDTFESYLESSATTDSEFIGRYSVSGPMSDRVRGRAMIYAKDRRGYVENVYPGAARQDGEEAIGGNVKFDIDVNDTMNLKLRGDYRNQFSNIIDKNTGMTGARQIAIMGGGDPVLGQRVMDDISLTNSDFDRFHDAESWGVAANLTWELSDSLTMKSISSYRDHYVDFNLDSEASPATASKPLGVTQLRGYHTDTSTDGKRGGPYAYDAIINSIEYFTQEIRFEYTSDAIEGLFGAFYNHNDEILYADLSRLNVTYPAVHNNFTIFSTVMDEALRLGNLYLRSWSAFGDMTYNLTDTFKAFAGLRWTNEELTNDFVRYNYLVPDTLYNTYETKPFHTLQVHPSVAPTEIIRFKSTRETNELTGRIGAMWDFMPNANVYASYARGFTGAGSNTAHTAVVELATVPPMTGDAYELGLKSTFLDSRLRLNMAVFKSAIREVQLFRTNPQLLLTEFANAGGVDIKGLELTTMALIGENFTLSGALSLLDTEMVGSLPQPCYAGQTADQGCVNLDGRPGNEQDINGKPSQNTPGVRYNIGGTYELPLPSMPFDAYATVAYTWTDEKLFEFSFQPIVAFEPPYGLADVSVGFTDKQGRYEVSVFGKNVFNKVFTVERAVHSIGGTTGFRALYDRNAHAYWGLKVKYNFL